MNTMDAIENAIGNEYLGKAKNEIEFLSQYSSNIRQPHSNTVVAINNNRQPHSNWIVNTKLDNV